MSPLPVESWAVHETVKETGVVGARFNGLGADLAAYKLDSRVLLYFLTAFYKHTPFFNFYLTSYQFLKLLTKKP